MAWNRQQEKEKKVNPEGLADKVLNNIIEYDFDVATSSDSLKIHAYPERFVWLVNMAEGVCVGSKIIARHSQIVDFDNLKPEEEELLNAARKLFANRYQGISTRQLNIENRARALLAEAVEGPYDAKLRQKEGELNILLSEGKISKKTMELELARYRFQLMVEAAESKKVIRKEMNY